MNAFTLPRATFTVMGLLFLCFLPTWLMAAPPDLTTVDFGAVRSTAKYSGTYNLGPTGMRGWIYVTPTSGTLNIGQEGLITDESRQILVTVVGPGTLADGVLAVNDVILGVSWGKGSDPVPLFTHDARKSFGWAIGEAEKTENAGILRIKRWRAGVTVDVAINLQVMGPYADTLPFNCSKSAKILAQARDLFVNQLLADPSFLVKGARGVSTVNHANAIAGLALLAAVAPGDPHYDEVQACLKAYARWLAPARLDMQSQISTDWSAYNTWFLAYTNIFLSEYYLSTGDASVLHGIHEYTASLAKAQSAYGTFGHSGSAKKTDGRLHGSIPAYGPVNAAGLPANISIILGKKALVAGGQTIDPEIDPAIARASNFFAWFVNKGNIGYGEHEPYNVAHASNGKNQMCALLFGLQDDRPTETEYFARMSVAGYTGREYGHGGGQFGYLWGAIGANVGGPLALAEYLKQVRWHLDLVRRTDGSFTFDGQEQYGPGTTADGTYLGTSDWAYSSNACYLLTYALPLKRLYITGKNANPAHILDATKVANAIAAGVFRETCKTYTVPQLIDALGEYDPIVRLYAATELASRPLSPADIKTLVTLVDGPTTNQRQGACEALTLLKSTEAVPALVRRVDKAIEPDPWVRALAAKALTSISADSPTAAASQVPQLLGAFTRNATDPDLIYNAANPAAADWTDPLQIANGALAQTLFYSDLSKSTLKIDKKLLYAAIQVALKQPDARARGDWLAGIIKTKFSQADVEALTPDLIECATHFAPANLMYAAVPRDLAIAALAKYHIKEGIPVALSMETLPMPINMSLTPYLLPGLQALATYGDAARWTLPQLRDLYSSWDPRPWDKTADELPTLTRTIATIENATTAPTLVAVLPVADSQVVVAETATAITLTGHFGHALSYAFATVVSIDTGITAASADHHALSYAVVTPPAHGTLTGTPPNLTYTPAPNYYGVDRFTFKTNDGTSDSAPGMVSLIVGVAGTGLKGEYFQNPDFTGPKFSRTDPTVNFDWANGAPDASMTAESFSVQWTGKLLAPETATYRFSLLNSEGAGLWINGILVLNDATGHALHWKDSVEIDLTAGRKYDLRLKYYKKSGRGVAQLRWIGPSCAGESGAVIDKEWFYDGAPVTNRAPVAYNQDVVAAQNTPLAVTLTGGDPAFTALAYAITGLPMHGALTGVPPNVIYTPAANYSGADRFTFMVGNVIGKSTAATVGVTVNAVKGSISARMMAEKTDKTPAAISVPNTSFAWNTNINADWSAPGKWINEGRTESALTPGGQSDYTLNFINSGNYTATNDLGDGFQLNRLNFSGPTVTLCGNRLNFTVRPSPSGGIAPSVNQNGNSSVKISTPISMAADLTFGGTGTGSVTLTGLVGSGTTTDGALIHTGNYTLVLNTPNDGFPGGLIVDNSTLKAATGKNTAFGGEQSNWQGARVKLHNSTLQLSGGASWCEAGFELSGNNTISATETGGPFFLGGIIGSGLLNITGNTTIAFGNRAFASSGPQTYSGDIRINQGPAGCVNLNWQNALGSEGTVTMSSPGGVHMGIASDGLTSLDNLIQLDADLVLSFTLNSMTLSLKRNISGASKIIKIYDTKDKGSHLQLRGVNNTYSGGTVFKSGTLEVYGPKALGTGPVMLGGRAADVSTHVVAFVNQCPMTLVNDFKLVGITAADDPARPDPKAPTVFNINTYDLEIAGNLSGSGGLLKEGVKKLTLSGINTCTGAVEIKAGVLAYTNATALGQGALDITDGAKVQLDYQGTRSIAALTLNGGAALPRGNYGSTKSLATFKNDKYFEGTGMVTVGPVQ